MVLLFPGSYYSPPEDLSTFSNMRPKMTLRTASSTCPPVHPRSTPKTIQQHTTGNPFPTRLRRAKSLPGNFLGSRDAGKALFWFRPKHANATSASRCQIALQYRRLDSEPAEKQSHPLDLPNLNDTLSRSFSTIETTCIDDESELWEYDDDEDSLVDEANEGLRGLIFLDERE